MWVAAGENRGEQPDKHSQYNYITRHVMGELIERLYERNHNTTIVITHDLGLMKRLGRVVFLRNRRIYYDGSFEAFARSDDPVILRFLSHGPYESTSPGLRKSA